MTQALTTRSGGTALALQVFGNERIEVIKQQLAPGISDAELQYFATVCEKTGLDPFGKPAQIYAIMRNEKDRDTGQKRPKLTIQVSVDGLRLIAARSKRYGGQTAPEWCGKDRVWVDFWDDMKPPVAARVGVRIVGVADPTYAVATWRSYAQLWNGEATGKWKEMPDVMLAKCAESLALRKAFPHEMAQGLRDIDIAGDDQAAGCASASVETIDISPQPVISIPDDADVRKAFWAKATQLGYLTAAGKLSKKRVHRALGLAETEGALNDWLDEGHSWREAIGLLEEMGEAAPLNVEAAPAMPVADAIGTVETATPHCATCGFAVDACVCGYAPAPSDEEQAFEGMEPARRDPADVRGR